MLGTAIAQLSALHARGHALGMAVNLSAHCLRSEGLSKAVDGFLSSRGMAPRHLTLEITESAIMSNDAEVLATLDELDRMGVMLAIDDFGTGYSSLAHLKRLPVDELKIDKSFVVHLSEETLDDGVIVRSTIDLGHNMGLKVVAEGLETSEGYAILKGFGCDMAQGFWLGHPVSNQEFTRLLV